MHLLVAAWQSCTQHTRLPAWQTSFVIRLQADLQFPSASLPLSQSTRDNPEWMVEHSDTPGIRQTLHRVSARLALATNGHQYFSTTVHSHLSVYL